MTAKTTHTFTRSEIVTAAAAALDNWDFSLATYPEECKAALEYIVEGSDDIGAEEPVEALVAYSDHETALIHWLQDYADTSR